MASGYINKVQILGNLGRDPEIRTFQNGNKVCNLRVATTETWKDRNTGEKREATEWHSVSVFKDGVIRFLEQYARKGTKILIDGAKLQTRKWQDQSGQDRYTTEIVVQGYQSDVQIIDGWAGSDRGGGSGGNSGGYGSGPPDDRSGSYSRGSGSRDDGPGGGRGPDIDDEIPF